MKYLSFLLFLCLIFFVSCKKGVDDPSFSLHTRKARLDGHWLMQKGTTSYTQGGYNVSYVFDGSEVKVYSTQSYVVYFGKSTMSVDFDKKGSFSIDETVVGYRSVLTGDWAFNAKSENYKSKEQLTMQVKDISIGSTYNCFLMQFASTCTYHIDRLSNDEIILLGGGTFINSKDEPVKYTSEFHLTKKK